VSAPVPDIRIGQGFDVHSWSDDPNRPLVLAGVEFTDAPGLVGHSDADAISHAVIDAMLGAVGAGDIGGMFPDTDPLLAGADSIQLLRRAAETLTERGWVLVNADCTVVLDSPKIAPHREAMEKNLSDAAGGPVTLKGKRTEGVAALGQGVQCFASALMVKS
jgi:2-C-methyl-D-erythritol 2,4-cyclodiphosphate synthase